MSAAQRRLKVMIATPLGPGGRGGMDRLSDLIIAGMPQVAGDIHVSALKTYGPGKRMLMPAYFLSALLKFAWARARSQVDLLHINVAGDGSAYRKAILATFARGLGVPYVIHVHGSRFRETWPSPRASLRAIVDSMLRHSRAILVLGESWAEHIRTHLPAVTDKIRVLPNAAPARASREPRTRRSDTLHIVFLGLLGPRKGSLLLIEALARRAGSTDWRATFAGNGDIAGHLSAAQQHGIAERLRFAGWLDTDGVDALLTDADIVVLPSYAENLPMAIIEAFAHGVPVIATPVGAIPEVVTHGKTGLITPVGDAVALAAAIDKLAASPELRGIMGREALRQHAERFEISAYVQRLAGIWRSAMQPSGA